jgi:purine-binding chemotaxis protein CheW
MSDLYPASAIPRPHGTLDTRPPRPVKTEKFVSFYIGRNLYAVHSSTVAEVVHPLAVTALPDMPPWLMGISNLRGEIAAVVNLKKLLGEDGVPPAVKTRLLILNAKDAEMALSFPVDALNEMLTISIDDIEEPAAADPAHFIGSTSTDTDRIRLIDIDRLFSSIRPT